MMVIKQLSVFLENKPGRLCAATDVLAKEGINISALTLADTSEFGVLRMIVDQPEKARQVLMDSGVIVRLSDVIAVAMNDAPGGAVGILHLLSEAGVSEDDAAMVIFGGPMMGTAICSLDEPIIKTTGAITVLSDSDAKRREATPCIHCGRCVTACPIGLNPTAYSKALNIDVTEDRMEVLEDEKIMLCMECGCCSFVCPASRPLVQNNRIAKAQLRDFRAHSATLKK